MIYSKYNLPQSIITPGWCSDLPSMTVPDQTLSVRELLERFTTGLLTPQSVWHDDVGDDFSDLDNPNPADAPDFDLVDRDALRDVAAQASAILQQAASRQRRKSEVKEAKESSDAKRSETKEANEPKE